MELLTPGTSREGASYMKPYPACLNSIALGDGDYNSDAIDVIYKSGCQAVVKI